MGKEQNLIFARKIGEGIKEDIVEKIVELLMEKGFFHKETGARLAHRGSISLPHRQTSDEETNWLEYARNG